MATGDLIVRNGQYEFQQILFNNGPGFPNRVFHSVKGLFGSDKRSSHVGRQLEPGAFPGLQDSTEKMLEITATTECADGAQCQSEIDLMAAAWQEQLAEIPFVFLKPGQAKRFIWVRPLDIDLPTSYDQSRGLLKWSARLLAADPRIYSLTERLSSTTILPGNTDAQVILPNSGTYFGGDYPIIEIDGPITNPRIANFGDSGRTIRLDGSISAGQTLVIDTWHKTLTIGGVNVVGAGWTVRSDNQWWRIWPDGFRENLVIIQRAGTTGTTPMRVKHRDVWI